MCLRSESSIDEIFKMCKNPARCINGNFLISFGCRNVKICFDFGIFIASVSQTFDLAFFFQVFTFIYTFIYTYILMIL